MGQPIQIAPLALLTGLAFAQNPPQGEEISSYRMALRAHGATLHVRGSAVFPPLAEEARAFAFNLSPLIHSPSFRLQCGSRRLRISTVESAEDGGDRKWTLRTRDSCAAGRVTTLAFHYRIERAAAPQMRLDERWGFAGGGGESWYPQRSFAERQTGRIEIEVPPGSTAIATGRQVGRAVMRRGTRFVFDIAAPAKFAFAYGPYRVAELSGAPGMRVLSTGDAEAARGLAGRLAPLRTTLTEIFGPFPYPAFALVEVDFQSQVLGTSEYGMIFADPSQMRGEFNPAYWAHEFAHQWWGNLVRPASRTPGATLLTEGIAQYGGLVALERTEGAASAAQYRRSGRGAGNAHSLARYREMIAAGQDRPLADFQPAGQEEILLNHRLATSKGAIVLRYFAELAGAERFHALLRSFVSAHSGRRATWKMFEDWIDDGTRGEFRWFLDQWLHQRDPPAITVRYCIRGDRISGEISQTAPGYRLPLPIELSGPWGRVPVLASASGTSSRFAFRAPGGIADATIDPDAIVPTRSTTAQHECRE